MNYKCTHCGWEGEWEKTIRYPSPDGYATECPLCNYLCCELSYTRVPPTEPGWYWYKDENIAKENAINKRNCGIIDKYMAARCDGFWCIYLDDYQVKIYYDLDIAELTGEWSERIEPPE